jgi:hypothetical protein
MNRSSGTLYGIFLIFGLKKNNRKERKDFKTQSSQSFVNFPL